MVDLYSICTFCEKSAPVVSIRSMSRPKMTLRKALERGIPRNGRLLIAVSGGIDSVCLLHGCIALAAEKNLTLEVAHVNHRLRPTSGGDAEFVSRLVRQAELPFHIEAASDPPKGANIESWARNVRYRFFGTVLEDRALQMVLTAHTASDLAETLLMRLISNKELKTMQRYEAERKILRPLLSVTRNEVEKYALENYLSYCEDETNQDTAFLRNRVRHVLLPLLRTEFDSRIEEIVASRAVSLQEDLLELDSQAKILIEPLAPLSVGSREWVAEVRSTLHGRCPALSWRICEQLLKDKLGFNLGRIHSIKLAAFFLGNSVHLELPGGLTLVRKDGGILFSETATEES